MENRSYEFNLPQSQDAIIQVIGVGGGGTNAVNHMYKLGIRDVEFVVCNTDKQSLSCSSVPNKLQIGLELTSGLGVGACPEKGKAAALESVREIEAILGNHTKMLFITAGMGGGTGTGAAPEIARIAKEFGILTVGIVTMPFNLEGSQKKRRAEEGITLMKTHCDAVLVVLNEKLSEIYGNLSMSEAFAKVDNVLTMAAKGIAEIITYAGVVNLDFEDVNTVMREAGEAVMGSGIASGEDRALRAIEQAVNSPLLNFHRIDGANKILFSISYSEAMEMTMDEFTVISEYVKSRAGVDADVIFGTSIDNSLGDSVRVTLVATGGIHPMDVTGVEQQKRVFDLGNPPAATPDPVPAVMRLSEPFEPKPYAKQVQPNPSISHWGMPTAADQKDSSSPTEQPPLSPDPLPNLDQDAAVPSPYAHAPLPTSEKPTAFPTALNGAAPAFSVDRTGVSPMEDPVLDELEGASLPVASKHVLIAARSKREQTLSADQGTTAQIDYAQMLKKPAYLRRNVQLEKVVPSMQRNLSNFVIDAQSKTVKKNSFFNDNVD